MQARRDAALKAIEQLAAANAGPALDGDDLTVPAATVFPDIDHDGPGGDTIQDMSAFAAAAMAEQDLAGVRPCARHADAGRHRGEGDRTSVGQIEPLQLVGREKAESPSIGRPEDGGRALGSGDRRRLERRDAA